ncbi:uncharacterized protein [Takifugu rubripes]|uniref:uncharacterized protein n=1 Tax=Takifugu rubripes TaxID=31033 RepID=UPI001145F3B2|nr:uncharacterized protein LOC115252015 [Takifugu rubripes]
MQQEAFVLPHTDTCFSWLDIIAILPLFSIGATSISVAALSELSEAQSRRAPLDQGSVKCCTRCSRGREITQPAEPEDSVLLFTSCVTSQIWRKTPTSAAVLRTPEADANKLIPAASAVSYIASIIPEKQQQQQQKGDGQTSEAMTTRPRDAHERRESEHIRCASIQRPSQPQPPLVPLSPCPTSLGPPAHLLPLGASAGVGAPAGYTALGVGRNSTLHKKKRPLKSVP